MGNSHLSYNLSFKLKGRLISDFGERNLMNTEFMLLAIYNKPRLTMEEVCQSLGITTATGYTHRSLGKFPVPMAGNPLTADVRDVAEALDKMRQMARLTLHAT